MRNIFFYIENYIPMYFEHNFSKYLVSKMVKFRKVKKWTFKLRRLREDNSYNFCSILSKFAVRLYQMTFFNFCYLLNIKFLETREIFNLNCSKKWKNTKIILKFNIFKIRYLLNFWTVLINFFFNNELMK